MESCMPCAKEHGALKSNFIGVLRRCVFNDDKWIAHEPGNFLVLMIRPTLAVARQSKEE